MLSKWSLQRKLIVFSFVTLLPLGLFAYYLIQENIAYTKRQILSDSSTTAYVVAMSVDDFLQAAETLLTALAQTPAMKAEDPAATLELLRSVYLTQQRFTNLFALSEDGTVFATLFWEDGEPPSAAGTRCVRDVLETGKPVIATTRISPITNEPEVVVAVPLKDANGRQVGVVGGALSLGELKLALTSLDTQQPIAIIVVDSEGTVVTHPDPRYVIQRENLVYLSPIQAVLQGQRGTAEYEDPANGETWIAAYSPVSTVPWGVLVAYPAKRIYADVQQTMLRNLLYFLLTVLSAVVLALLFIGRIVRPLRELIDRTRSIAPLATDEASPAQVDDELQQLATAFQVLSDNLRNNVNELTKTKSEIQRQTLQLQQLLTRITRSKEEERKRLALDIHDGIAQFLVIALQQTRALEKLLLSDPESALGKLLSAQKLLAQSVTELDRVVFDLRPPSLGDIGLITALQNQITNYEQTCNIPCVLEVQGTPFKLPDALELAVYRIVQEALHNIRKHAKATAARILVEFDSRALKVTVVDDGKGFDKEQVSATSDNCLGLIGMKERAEGVGGRLTVESAVGFGTKVGFEVSVEQPAMAKLIGEGQLPHWG